MENFTFWANIFCKLKAGWLALFFFWKCFQATVLSCVSFVFSLLGQTRGWLGLPRPLTIFPDSIPSVAFEDSRASSCHLLMNASSFFFFDSYCCFSTQRLPSAAVVSKGCQYLWSEEYKLVSFYFLPGASRTLWAFEYIRIKLWCSGNETVKRWPLLSLFSYIVLSSSGINL